MRQKELGATHVVLLTRVFDKSEGDVLEIGTGYYSTLLLHWLAQIYKRHVYSYETSKKWYDKAKKYESEFHHIIFCDELDTADFDTKHWGVVFIDHAPEARRQIEINRLKDKCDYMVIHDTESRSYNYGSVFPLFKYRYDYKKAVPHTSVVSNINDLENIK